MSGIRSSALALAIIHTVLVLVAATILFALQFFESSIPSPGVIAQSAQRLVSEAATGSYPAFVFAFSQRKAVGGVAHERGTLVFCMVSAPLIAVRMTVTAVVPLWRVANESFSAVELAVGISSLVAVVSSLAIAFIALVQLSRVRHLVEHFLMLGVVALCLVVSWGIDFVTFADLYRKPLELQYLIVLVCSPIAHILMRQMFDNTYTQIEAVLSLFVSGLLAVSFLVGFSLQVAELATANAITFQPAVWLIADLVLATMFIAHAWFGFRVARRFREATYSPLLEDRTLTSIGYASQSGNEK